MISQKIEQLAPRFLRIGIILELVVLALSWMESPSAAAPFFQAAARLSGRVSLLFFAVLMVYATLSPSFERGTAAFKTKYLLYRDFAIIHIIHWFLLAASVSMTAFELRPIRVLAGAFAYALVVAMPLLLRRETTTPVFLAGIQGTYLFWVWLIFTMTYTARLTGGTPTSTGSPAAWWPLFFVLIALIFWRSIFLLNGMKKKGTPHRTQMPR